MTFPHTTPAGVGFVGAGRIGSPMVQRLLAAGLTVTAFARRADVRQRLSGFGAVPTHRFDDLAHCEIVLSCLFSDTQLRDVGPRLLAVMRPGSVLVSHTTGTPAVLDELARLARPRGIGVVEAPFSGSADDALAGRLTVYLGGDGPDVDRAAGVVRAYADPVLRTGRAGSALLVKLLNNTLFAATSQLTLVAIDAAAQLGIDESVLLDALAAGSGGSRAADRITRLGGSAAFSARVAEFLRKDVDAARAVAEDLGVDVDALFRAACDGPIEVGPTPDVTPNT